MSEQRKHKLKTWPESFEAMLSGRKTHEWRSDDRGFAVNDLLVLEEFVPCKSCAGTGRVRDYMESEDCGCERPHGKCTGRYLEFFVTFITRHPEFGVPKGWVVMSVGSKRIELPPRDPRVDPLQGDRVEGGVDGERAEVLKILRHHGDSDPALGPLPHVVARVDSRWGQRSTSTMSLETWRKTFAEKPSGEIAYRLKIVDSVPLADALQALADRVRKDGPTATTWLAKEPDVAVLLRDVSAPKPS